MAIIKIAKTGDDATTTPDKDLAFNSDYPCFNVTQETIVTVTTDSSGNGSATYSHNLGYYPMYKTYVKVQSGGYALLEASDIGGGVATAYATTAGIIVNIKYGTASTNYYFIIKVFGNSADDAIGTTNNNTVGRMRVARTGYDAKSATDIRELVFQSGLYTLKYDSTLSGSFTQTVASGDLYKKTIYHSLGYVPFIFVKESDNGGSTTAKMAPVFQSSYGVYYEIFSNSVVITLDNVMGSSDITFNIKYFIYRDKLI